MEQACRPWSGEAERWQDRARDVWLKADPFVAWHTWFDTSCDTPRCLAHLARRRVTALAYPASTCTYCGVPSDTRDHLMPRGWTGEAARRDVLTVPACRSCNSAIGARLLPTITERRAYAQERILRKAKMTRARALDVPPRCPNYSEYGRTLRGYMEASWLREREVADRISWPHDPNYDFDAMAISGVADPYAAGLLLAPVLV